MAKIEMSETYAAHRLAAMHTMQVKLQQSVARKRNLRASEKACWLADIHQNKQALEIAYQRLTGKPLVVGAFQLAVNRMVATQKE